MFWIGIPRKAPKIIPVIWRPPPESWVKINTDGSAFGTPSISGAGGIFRNARGFSKGAFAFHTGDAPAFVAELKAAIFAIQKASDCGWRTLWLESDSMYVVNLFRTKTSDVPWCCRLDWADCLSRLAPMRVVVSHVYREGNRVADKLANFGAGTQGFHWWHLFPQFCSQFVYEDFSSRECYRFM